MWTIEEIQALIFEIITIKEKTKRDKIPEYNPIYLESIRLARSIKLHSEPFPDVEAFYKKRAPKEKDEERKERKNKSEPITYSDWIRAENQYNRILQEGNFKIDFPEERNEDKAFDTQNYLRNEYPRYGDVIGYYRSVFIVKKNRDGNGVIAHKPINITRLENGEIDRTKVLTPIAVIYASWQVIRFDFDHTLILLDEKSIVDHGSTKKREGLIFEFYDDTNIWRITQVGRKIDNTFDFEIFWEHNLGFLPVKKLMGVPKEIGRDILYTSQFMPAVFHLNNVLWDASDFSLIKNAFAKPDKWAVGEKCRTNGCMNGFIAKDNKHVHCQDCNGTGVVPMSNQPGAVRIVPIPKGLDKGTPMPTPPFSGYITPPVESLDFYDKQIKEGSIEAFRHINIDLTPRTNGPKTATEIIVSQSARFTSMLTFSNETFDCLAFTIMTLGLMRQPNFQEPSITPPNKFDTRSEEELIFEYNQAAGAPESYRRAIYRELLRVRFNNDIQGAMITDLIMAADRILTLNKLEVISSLASKLADEWEGILHDSATPFIRKLSEENPTFFDQELSAQVEQLQQKAKDKAAEIADTAPGTETNLLAEIGTGG